MNKLNKLTHKINIMKKNLFVSAMALCTLFFASCSQDETLSEVQDNGLMTISVASPEASPLTKAVTTVDGYTLTCVLQMVDEAGEVVNNATDQSAQLTAAFQGDNATFTFDKKDYPTATQALFWAEYRNAEGKSVYNSDDLTNIGYATISFDLTNADLMAATDAFCGTLTLETAQPNSSVTLERPFAQINVTPTNGSSFSSYTNMTVTYNTTSGFNVFDKTTDATATVTYTNSSFSTVAAGTWFTTMVFAPESLNSLGKDNNVTIALTGSSTEEDVNITLPGEDVTIDSNMQMNVSFEATGDGVPSDITVTVGVDNEYTKPELKVGAYVTASGEPTLSAADAAGIVIYMGAMGEDVPANYPTELQSKTIKAYAVALTNVAASRQALNTAAGSVTFTEQDGTNGTQTTTSFLNTLEDGVAFATTYNTFVTDNALTGENVSDWYIPTLSQLTTFMDMLFTMTANDTPDNETLKGMSEFALTNGVMFDREPIATVYYASSSANDQGNPSGVRINVTDGTVTNAQAAGLNVTTGIQSPLCRPMFTIFE